MKMFKRRNKEILEEISELNFNNEAIILKNDDLIQLLCDINNLGKLSNKLISNKRAILFLLENAYVQKINDYLYLTNKGTNLLNVLGIKESVANKLENSKIEEFSNDVLNYYEIKPLSHSIFSKDISFIIQEYPHVFAIDRNEKVIKINLIINCIPDLFDFLFRLRQYFKDNWSFVFYYQTNSQRKNYFNNKINHILYLIISIRDFFRKIFFGNLFHKKGLNKDDFYNEPYSKAEILGRMIYAGFSIVKDMNSDLYNKLRLISNEIIIRRQEIHYGPLIKMKKLGKNEKHIYLFKIRTLYPYSEFMQEYIFKNYDFLKEKQQYREIRVTKSGIIIRRLWLDELPSIINLIKGDLKLIGIRALSEKYLQLYPPEFRNYRSKFKPGLLPPFYADLPKTFEEIMESERKYLSLYGSNPIKTDFYYLFKGIRNLLLWNS